MEHYITTAQLLHYDFTFSLSFHGSDHNTAESQKQILHDDTKTFRTILRDGSVLLIEVKVKERYCRCVYTKPCHVNNVIYHSFRSGKRYFLWVCHFRI